MCYFIFISLNLKKLSVKIVHLRFVKRSVNLAIGVTIHQKKFALISIEHFEKSAKLCKIQPKSAKILYLENRSSYNVVFTMKLFRTHDFLYEFHSICIISKSLWWLNQPKCAKFGVGDYPRWVPPPTPTYTGPSVTVFKGSQLKCCWYFKIIILLSQMLVKVFYDDSYLLFCSMII